MNVIKRDGRAEEFNNDKIHDVLFWAIDGIKGVTVSDIEIKVAPQFYDKITSHDVHKILVQGAADMITERTPNYQYVAGNLLNFYLRKEVFGASDNMPTLFDVITTNVAAGVYDEIILKNYTKSETIYQGSSVSSATATAKVSSQDGIVIQVYRVSGQFQTGVDVTGSINNEVTSLVSIDDQVIQSSTFADNEEFETEGDSILDFSEIDPWSEGDL